ncbi:MAG: Si-specific NAD(P)(+) transhydrogenase [Candidatus Rokubacteria bacterium]|nr:Si-specific NAD(P)(+) transhydrogenase [Candidatus Rokubacteria bacterium]
MNSYDLVVIGSGPAGEKGAARAAYFGKRVALIERAPDPGGAGVNTGTVPSKTLRETALYFSGLHQRGLYGVDYTVKRDLTVRDFMYREQEVVRSLREVVSWNIERHRIDLIRGQATFEDPHTVRVSRSGAPDRLVRGDVVLIATGSIPNRGRDIPFGDPRIYDSDTILGMERLPRSLAVIGAGVIGCEYTTIFAAMAIRATLIDGRDRLLSFLDAEISDRFRLQMELLGVDLRLREGTARIEPGPDTVRLELRSGAVLEVDSVFFAAGRLGNTECLGLERIGIAVGDRGHVTVNEHYQTVVPHIYAAGDVIGFPALAATSMEQARVAIGHAFDLQYKTRVAPIFPLAVYTIPEVSMVGETEESCRAKRIDYCVGRALYRHNARGQIVGDLAGQIKLVFRASDKVLLGVHIIGEAASELIHVGLMLMQAGGTIDTFIDTVFNYPTLGDAYKYAAYDGLGNLERRREGPSARSALSVEEER